MLDFARYPWFAEATMAEIRDVTLLHGHHLHWPRLDVDLHLESIEHPERFPLVSRAGRKQGRARATPGRPPAKRGSR